MTDIPQLTLITPGQMEVDAIAPRIGAILDAHPFACVRLGLVTRDMDMLSRAADSLRETAHARDVAVVIEDHYRLVGALGLDGVHLSDGSRHLREARKELGADAIVGAFCGTSRHNGITAAEIGADYVTFGPLTASPGLGDGSEADLDLFEWWSEMIEVPVVAEGGLNHEKITALLPLTDFFALGDELWLHPDGELDALKEIAALVH